MKSAGDYALMYANGTSWKEVIEEIRAEAVAEYKLAWGPGPWGDGQRESDAPYVEFVDTP